MDLFNFANRIRKVPSGYLLVRSGQDLLKSHQKLVNQIAGLVGTPPLFFQQYYNDTLISFADFVQEIPLSIQERSITLLEYKLSRVIQALARRRGYLLPPGVESEIIAAEADIWTYAVFLAALMHNLGACLLMQEVDMVDRKGDHIGYWEPYLGTMPDSAICYRLNAAKGPFDSCLANQLTVLLIPHLVPEMGQRWIWGNKSLIVCVLGTLTNNVIEAGILREIVEPAVKQLSDIESGAALNKDVSSQDSVDQKMIQDANSSNKANKNVEPSSVALQKKKDSKTAYSNESDDPAKQFLQWLREGLASGKIPCNQPNAAVFVIEQGVLLVSPDIFQQFGGLDWQQLQKRFVKLRLHMKTDDGENLFSFYHVGKPSEAIQGLVVADIQILFSESESPPVYSDLKSID